MLPRRGAWRELQDCLGCLPSAPAYYDWNGTASVRKNRGNVNNLKQLFEVQGKCHTEFCGALARELEPGMKL